MQGGSPGKRTAAPGLGPHPCAPTFCTELHWGAEHRGRAGTLHARPQGWGHRDPLKSRETTGQNPFLGQSGCSEQERSGAELSFLLNFSLASHKFSPRTRIPFTVRRTNAELHLGVKNQDQRAEARLWGSRAEAPLGTPARAQRPEQGACPLEAPAGHVLPSARARCPQPAASQ